VWFYTVSPSLFTTPDVLSTLKNLQLTTTQ
jgi:hypothetical protein